MWITSDTFCWQICFCRWSRYQFHVKRLSWENKKINPEAIIGLCWQKSQPSRIVNVSSLAHRYGSIKKDDLNSEKSYSEVQCYSQSKLANVLFTRELAKRLSGTRVTVNALHPGTVNTELARHIGHMSVLFNKYVTKTFLYLFFKTAKAGAQTSIYAGEKSNSGLFKYFVITLEVKILFFMDFSRFFIISCLMFFWS